MKRSTDELENLLLICYLIYFIKVLFYSENKLTLKMDVPQLFETVACG